MSLKLSKKAERRQRKRRKALEAESSRGIEQSWDTVADVLEVRMNEKRAASKSLDASEIAQNCSEMCINESQSSVGKSKHRKNCKGASDQELCGSGQKSKHKHGNDADGTAELEHCLPSPVVNKHKSSKSFHETVKVELEGNVSSSSPKLGKKQKRNDLGNGKDTSRIPDGESARLTNTSLSPERKRKLHVADLEPIEVTRTVYGCDETSDFSDHSEISEDWSVFANFSAKRERKRRRKNIDAGVSHEALVNGSVESAEEADLNNCRILGTIFKASSPIKKSSSQADNRTNSCKNSTNHTVNSSNQFSASPQKKQMSSLHNESNFSVLPFFQSFSTPCLPTTNDLQDRKQDRKRKKRKKGVESDLSNASFASDTLNKSNTASAEERHCTKKSKPLDRNESHTNVNAEAELFPGIDKSNRKKNKKKNLHELPMGDVEITALEETELAEISAILDVTTSEPHLKKTKKQKRKKKKLLLNELQAVKSPLSKNGNESNNLTSIGDRKKRKRKANHTESVNDSMTEMHKGIAAINDESPSEEETNSTSLGEAFNGSAPILMDSHKLTKEKKKKGNSEADGAADVLNPTVVSVTRNGSLMSQPRDVEMLDIDLLSNVSDTSGDSSDEDAAASNKGVKRPRTGRKREMKPLRLDATKPVEFHTENTANNRVWKIIQKELDDRGIQYNTGAWSHQENTQLKKNWNLILEECPFAKPHLLLMRNHADPESVLDIKQYIQDSNFYIQLGEGIRRPLYNVYIRARKMFMPGSNLGVFTQEETEALERLVDKQGRRAWQAMSDDIGRSGRALNDKYRTLKESIAKGKWTAHELEQLKAAVAKVTEEVGGDDESTCFNLPWGAIAHLVPTRNAKQCRLRWILKQDVDRENQIDWTAIQILINSDLKPQYFQRRWHRLKVKLKNHQQLSFDEILDRLSAAMLERPLPVFSSSDDEAPSSVPA